MFQDVSDFSFAQTFLHTDDHVRLLMVVCCRSDKDLVNQERSLAMFRDDSKSAGSRNREVGEHTHMFAHTSH